MSLFYGKVTKAIKLLLDAGMQYNGYNNGDICLTTSLMEKRGWTSKAGLQEALEELVHYGMIVLTRQGGRNRASLYALTWREIDECSGKLDIKSSKIPPGDWKTIKEKYIPKRKRKK